MEWKRRVLSQVQPGPRLLYTATEFFADRKNEQKGTKETENRISVLFVCAFAGPNRFFYFFSALFRTFPHFSARGHDS
jgi:hypothetical protein